MSSTTSSIKECCFVFVIADVATAVVGGVATVVLVLVV